MGLLRLLAAAAACLHAADAGPCDDGKMPCFKLAGGVEMPQVAMGTWSGSFKDCSSVDYSCVKQHARFSINNWLHIGGTHIDTANDYRTQTSVAEALVESGMKREDVFVTTKCPGAIGFEATIQCADDNLQMLGQFGTHGVAYIDLLLVHFPFKVKPMCRFHRDTPECKDMVVPVDKSALQDTWRAMEELKRMGVVKAIGVSDFNITQLQQILETAKEPIEVNQVEWNPKHHQDDMLAFCKQKGILLQAWSPLGGAEGSVLSETVVRTAAAAHNVSGAQVALRWSLQQGVAAVVGTANPDHQQGDLHPFGFELSDEEMKSISALQERPTARNATLFTI